MNFTTILRVLPCGHSFCFKCVQGIHKDNLVCCPLCRKTLQGSLEKIPLNLTLSEVVENVKKEMSWSVLFVRTSLSGGVRLVRNILCDECLNDHSRNKFTAKHQVVDVKRAVVAECSKHKKTFDLYCQNCTSLICTPVLLWNIKHLIISIEEATTEQRKRILSA